MYWKCVIGKEPIKSSPCIDALTGYVWVGSHDHHMYALDIKVPLISDIAIIDKGSSLFCFSRIRKFNSRFFQREGRISLLLASTLNLELYILVLLVRECWL